METGRKKINLHSDGHLSTISETISIHTTHLKSLLLWTFIYIGHALAIVNQIVFCGQLLNYRIDNKLGR